MRRSAFCLLLWLSASPALGHGLQDPHVRARLVERSAGLSDLHIQLHRTSATQIVLANPSGPELSVLDAFGHAFMRIGPDGVQADTASPWWQAGIAPPSAGIVQQLMLAPSQHQTRWQTVSRQPSWGWFDARLNAVDITVEPQVRTAGKGRIVGWWQIALRRNDHPASIGGSYYYQPPLGPLRVELHDDLPASLQVTVLPGVRPALWLEYSGKETLLLNDITGNPYIKLEAGKCYQWVASSWQLLRLQPKHHWIDARMLPTESDGEILHWQIPLQLGKQVIQLAGTSRRLAANIAK